MDCVMEMMKKSKIPFTQRNYIELAYMGDKHSFQDLEGEERFELPEGFEDWPTDDLGRVN